VSHGTTGLLAPMDDAARLAEHVVSLLADPAGAWEMGQRGRARVADAYGADRLVRDIEALYTDLLRQRSA
jgi:glycosyltransferase involved in cell wall biosynthesis